ncbi:MAG: thermonuclease family protein [Bacteroidales bacterium]
MKKRKINMRIGNFLSYSVPAALLLVAISCYSPKKNAVNSAANVEQKQESEEQKKEYEYYKVIKVTDGDTFVIDDGSEKGARVRLIGVDTPESRKTGRKVVGYYGKEAKEFSTNFLLNKRVRIEYDVNKYDQYMRLLGYVYLEDGTFVNEYLVKNGYAMVMTVPPNVKFSELFLRCQQEAREKNLGLWGKNVDVNTEFK